MTRHFQIGLILCFLLASICNGFDGKVVPPRDYKGSLEETAQEAILIFHGSKSGQNAMEDMILKIQVEGDAKQFVWIIPFPNEPEIAKEDPALFRELFQYVDFQKRRMQSKGSQKNKSDLADARAGANDSEKVEVLKRETVGDFDITTVRETEEGGLNPWLESEGFQTLDNAEDVLKFYRDKGYVFACIKVSADALANQEQIESHPLRFTFATGGDDGIFFPMKMTGLQSEPFDVNLYVFYSAWINADLNRFGFRNRGMELKYRDWDTPRCKSNAGKNYSLPEEDSLLSAAAHTLPTVKRLFQKLHPGESYYLTNIGASNLKPEDVRHWSDDLWLFPHYVNRDFVPLDARGEDWEPPAPKLAKKGFGFMLPLGLGLSIGVAILVLSVVLSTRKVPANKGLDKK